MNSHSLAEYIFKEHPPQSDIENFLNQFYKEISEKFYIKGTDRALDSFHKIQQKCIAAKNKRKNDFASKLQGNNILEFNGLVRKMAGNKQLQSEFNDTFDIDDFLDINRYGI